MEQASANQDSARFDGMKLCAGQRLLYEEGTSEQYEERNRKTIYILHYYSTTITELNNLIPTDRRHSQRR